MVLMGDFNTDFLNSDGRDDYLNSVLLSYLYSLVSIPTRITQSLGNLIDNIFVDGRLLNGCLADVLISDGSDYFMLISRINSCSSKPPTNKINIEICQKRVKKN